MFSHLDETQQGVPGLYREGTFCEDIGQLVFGVNVLYPNNGILYKTFKEPTEVDPVCSTDVSHKDTPTLYCHFDDCFIIL